MSPGELGPPTLSVVLPCYRTRDSLDELLARLGRSCPEGAEYVLVDDACPDESGDAVLVSWAHLSGRLVRIDRNVGQHAAVQAGLRAARGERVVVMDADLQDAPEDVPVLLARLRVDRPHLVSAARRGTYADPGRQRTARLYRRLARILSRGGIPADAGMFSALSRPAVDRIVALDDHAAPLLPAAARAGVSIVAVPVTRQRRPRGASATGGWRRVRIGVRGLLTLTPLQPVLRLVQPIRRRAPDQTVVELHGSPTSSSTADPRRATTSIGEHP